MKKRIFTLMLTLLVAVVGMWAVANKLTEPTPPPAGLDFSALSEANPVTTFSVGQGQYMGAIALFGGTWKSIAIGTKWNSTYKNEFFQLSISSYATPTYHSYLVSPAIDMVGAAGSQLSFTVSGGITKGLIPALRLLLIDKQGNTLKEIWDYTAADGQDINNYSSATATLPTDLTGVAFIAFASAGNSSGRASYRVKDITLAPASSEVSVTADPATGLTFDKITVGEMSVRKAFTVFIKNFSETPSVNITGANAGDFELDQNTPVLTATGGKVGIFFKPTAAGSRQANVIITAGEKSVTVPLEGLAEGGAAPEPTESVELLTDQYFYNFNENKPSDWKTIGITEKLEGAQGNHANTGFALRLDTREIAADGFGAVSQKVSLSQVGKKVNAGNELEGMIHYYCEDPAIHEGSIRLACRWLNAAGEEITTTEEKLLLNNPDAFFSRQKVWTELRFRTIAPEGATDFEFGIRVKPGTVIRFDDCSLLLLAAADRKPFVTVVPQWRVLHGEVGKTYAQQLVVQSMHLTAGSGTIEISGEEGLVTMAAKQLPDGDKTQVLDYTFAPKKKGVMLPGKPGTPAIRFNGSETPATLAFSAEIIDAANKPSVALQGATEIPAMKGYPNETSEQTLTFDVSGVIGSVKIAVRQETGGIFRINNTEFFYSATQDKVLNNTVKLTFAPKAEGSYTATLELSSPMMDTVRYTVNGVCRPAGEGWTEAFSADRPMDPRFTGDTWKNYHLFDRGYYRLDGRFTEAGSIVIEPKGILDCDEWFVNGIRRIGLAPKTATTNLSAEVSVDGGGHWITLSDAQNGIYRAETHRPTRFRLVNKSDADITLSKIELNASAAEERTNFSADGSSEDPILKAMLRNADKEPLKILKENFQATRHTRAIDLPGWQNLPVIADRPFLGWAQKNKQTGASEEQCAQISFYKHQEEDTREHESWLISPTLSYAGAASKILTWRLRYELPTSDGQEKFGVYLITETDEAVRSHYLDITTLLPVEKVDAETWYDFFVDLSTIEGLKIDDKFHVAFSMHSPVGGKQSSLTFMIDEVTFGRTDLPTVKADKEALTFHFLPKVNATPQGLNITTERNDSPVNLTLVPARLSENFIIAPATLPAAGGAVAVGFTNDKENDLAAALLVQVRGGQSKLVKLLAVNATGIDMPEADRRLKVYPTETDGTLRVSGSYSRYYIFAGDGQLVKQGAACTELNVSELAPAHYLIRLITADGSVRNMTFIRR